MTTRTRFIFFPEIIDGKFKWLCFITEHGTYEPNGYRSNGWGGGELTYRFKKN